MEFFGLMFGLVLGVCIGLVLGVSFRPGKHPVIFNERRYSRIVTDMEIIKQRTESIVNR